MSSDSSLFQAVTSGDAKALATLLSEGADVNAVNAGGQTTLILAVISGKHHLLRSLLEAGADPALRDKTGLNAIDWAKRKGRNDLAEILQQRFGGRSGLSEATESPVETDQLRDQVRELPKRTERPSADEKSRRFLAGLKQRLDEQAERQQTPVQAPPVSVEQTVERNAEEQLGALRSELTRDALQVDVPVIPPRMPVEAEIAVAPPKSETSDESPVTAEPVRPTPPSSSSRKRCPQCNTIYNSDLLAYCAYHVVPLVDANEPVVPPPEPSSSSTTLLWILVSITLCLAAFAGFFLTKSIFSSNTVQTPTGNSIPVRTTRKGVPVVGKELADKIVSVTEAEVPYKPDPQPFSIIVKVSVDKNGKVSSARSSGPEDDVFKAAAIEAAQKSTFDVEKLKGRNISSTITYNFE